MNEQYINISLDLSYYQYQILDIRVPKILTIKEILKRVSDAYELQLNIVNPTVRIVQTGKVIPALKPLYEEEMIRNGVLLVVETL